MHQSPQTLVTKLWNLLTPGADDGKFAAQDLLNQAMKRSGLSDFGDDKFLEGMNVFLTSARETGGFHAFGNFYLRQLVVAMLVHRLRMVELLRTQPEILQEQISKPVFVLGLPRSGTTLLFNLLAQDPAHRFMFNWEAFISQVPPPGNYTLADDPRRKQAKWVLRMQNYLMPELEKIHEFTAAGSEECTPILMQSFATQALAGGFEVPAYSHWLNNADHAPTYRHHKRTLQALQWRYPAQRWLLKSPDHLSGLDALLKEYPDARFIHIHRDPSQSVSSWASLCLVYRELYYPQIDTRELGSQVMERLACDLDRYMELRAEAPAGQFFDIRYSAFTGDPVSVLEEAYAHFDFDFKDTTRQAVLAYLQDNPVNKHGVHSYKPEDFGLTGELIQDRFAPYISRFLSTPDGTRV